MNIKDVKIEDIKENLKKNGYIGDEDIHYALYTSLILGKPLLIDGPPGVGKTEIAKVLSKMFGLELIRLQCYEGMDISKVLYDINYPKQLLYQNIMKENLTENLKNLTFEEAIKEIDNKANFYGEEFLIKRPVLQSFLSKKTSVLLIDELDKADLEVEAYLLEALSDYSISIPEYGTVSAKNKPIVVITSNNQREISEALKRRCIYLYIDYPSIEKETEILNLQGNIDLDFSRSIAKLINKIRTELSLKQSPSIAESIEWAELLFKYLNVTELTETFKEQILASVNVLAKNNTDLNKIKNFIEDSLNEK